MQVTLNRLLAAALLSLSLGHALAAGSAPEPTDKLDGVRAHIATKQWDQAIDELKRVNDTGSAEWNNLMGYSLRKAKTPDLAGSEKYYDEALRINPRHVGTLEYSGELYLMKGDLPKAEQRLATLDKVCVLPCKEYKELKQAIERYKANGNSASGY